MISLVLDPAGHRVPTVHPYRFIEYGPHRAVRVTHVVFPDLSRRVRQSLWALGSCGVEQDPRCFNGVAGNADNARPLLMMIALLVGVHDPSNLARFIAFDS